ncbi:QRFP-like peptide receptor [Actinia tenebrosa]|uniref:QRFP-like peptide receptor n=1 Tax=Actinia tenebrosa TaxID=6105 RepID=A0A6P8I1T7_ACTTE|nr:QRFP-like peptide receptor [Actinia tenebrosa]
MSSSLDPNSSINGSFLNSSSSPLKQNTPFWILNVTQSYTIPFTVCYALILALSVVGNTSIIAIVSRNASMRSTINYLIANMAATDLVSSIVVISQYFSIVHNFSYEWKVPGVLGKIFCKLCPFIRDVSLAVSVFSMVSIAFDRFFAVVFPMRRTPRLLHLRVLLPIIWCLSLGTFTVHLFNYQTISIQGVNLCFHKWPLGDSETVFYFSKLIGLFLVPLAIIAILYTLIALRMRRQKIPGQQSSDATERRRRRNNNVLKTSVTIVFFFFLCWCPYQILLFKKLVIWGAKGIPKTLASSVQVLTHVFNLLSYMSLAINPYICFAFSSNYRNRAKSLFPFSLFFINRVSNDSIRMT